ncbi:MAG TPA: type II secretion system F family protein [Gemmatimonadaceae bacterium]|jgi:type II secretory pathway component PulF|nr:type II secretion system F family protein [Gemmatimonadaceae bacterium]
MSVRFQYRAATPVGQVVEGVVHAASRQVAFAELQRQRLYPVALHEVESHGVDRTPRRVRLRSASTLWTRSVATLLRAGVPLDQALGFTAGHVGHAGMAEAIREVRRAVQSGSGLADALARYPRYFDGLFVSSVAAGESTGALDTVFERLASHLEETAELRSQVRSALLYPALMSVVSIVGVAVLLGFVIPRFAAVLSDMGGKLPATTRFLMVASAVVTKGWWAWLLIAVGTTYAVPTALARPDVRRRWHAARLGSPWFGDFERKYLTARFARTFGLLLRSGIPVLPALHIARASAPNVVFQDGVDQAMAAVTEGSALSPALAGTLPSLALQMLAVGEESGQLEELCLRVGDAYDADVRRSLRTMVALIEPLMILVFGGLVGFVALAMLQAIYGINLNQL